MFITALRALLMLQSLISIFHLPWASFYSTDTWNLLYFRTWVFCSISLNSVPLSPHSLSPKPSLFLKCSSELDLCMTHHLTCYIWLTGFPGGAVVKKLLANVKGSGDVGSVPRLGRSCGIGNGNPLQYSCRENPMDRGACWATVHGVASSWTWLNTHTHTHTEY